MVVCVWCSKSAPKLLPHVTLLLAIISGAGLATLARLKWDPSTYLVFRGLLPTEYRVLGGVLCFGTFLLIALAHLAAIALNIRRGSCQHVRRAMFFTYSALMVALIIVEICTAIWLCVRVFKWLQTDEAAMVLEFVSILRKIISKVDGLLGLLSQFDVVFEVINDAMQEVINDLPCNINVAVFFVVLAAILQPLAVLLAWNSAFTYSNFKSTKEVFTIRYNPATTESADKEKGFKHRIMYLDAINK